MIKFVFGDLLNAKKGILAHQVNCKGVMGAGLALQIRSRFPKVFSYYKYFLFMCENEGIDPLGLVDKVSVGENLFVANLFAQRNVGRNGVFTDYEALETALRNLKGFAEQKKLPVILPFKLGCGLAGGDWDTVMKIINRVFKESTVDCYIVKKQ